MKILLLFSYIFFFLYPYKLYQRIRRLKDLLHTLWIRNNLGNMGLHSRICHDCRIGGNGSKISIGDYSYIGSHSIIACWEQYGKQIFPNATIVIGDNCSIGEYSHLTACNKITIGNGLLTGRYVYIGDNAHGGLSEEESSIMPLQRELKSKGEIAIGNNVWLGDKVAVLSGVHIGNNVIIAANAVVTKDIPSNCIAAGVPAKVIKTI